MTCNATDHQNHPTHPTAKPPAASAPTAAAGQSPASTPASPPAPGSATDVAASTLSEMIAQAASLARLPAPTANLLYSSIEWYAARPGTRRGPLTVRLWIGQSAKLVRQYQDLLAVLVEMQVEALDHHSQANTHPQED